MNKGDNHVPGAHVWEGRGVLGRGWALTPPPLHAFGAKLFAERHACLLMTSCLSPRSSVQLVLPSKPRKVSGQPQLG